MTGPRRVLSRGELARGFNYLLSDAKSDNWPLTHLKQEKVGELIDSSSGTEAGRRYGVDRVLVDSGLYGFVRKRWAAGGIIKRKGRSTLLGKPSDGT